jgi:hypothetical protein
MFNKVSHEDYLSILKIYLKMSKSDFNLLRLVDQNYFMNFDKWLYEQGLLWDNTILYWKSDEQRVEFFLRWL